MKKYVIILLLTISGLIIGINGIERMAVGQAKKEPIKLGMVSERSGAMAVYGYSHEKVMNAAVTYLNKRGGIMGRPIELYIEDDETKPSVGALKFRKLVETYGVDFVFDSNHSGICIACNPIAKELRTPYFNCCASTEIAGDKGNRWVFTCAINVAQMSKGASEFAIKNIGKKWVTVVVDFAWGWSAEKDFTADITKKGGTVLKSVRVPQGTGDWLPYLKGNIPSDAEAVFFTGYGSDTVSFLRDLYAIRPNIKKLGAIYALSATDPKALGAEGEGFYILTSYPARLEGLNTKANKAYRELIGVDPDGKEIGTGKAFILAYDWSVWQPVFALKIGVEKSGWKNKADNPKLIKTLEGMAFKESVEFPQGDMHIRAEDHVTMTGLYVEQIQKGELKVVATIPSKDTIYPPLIDFRKTEPF